MLKLHTGFLVLALAFSAGAVARASETKPDCGGGKGLSVLERSKACKERRPTSTGQEWMLIQRLEGREIWRDNSTGLIWSAPLQNAHPQYATVWACTHRTRFLDERGRIMELNWQAPTARDFSAANKNGAREVLQSMDSASFWTSSNRGSNARLGLYFNGQTGEFGEEAQDYLKKIICVAHAY